MEQMRLDKFLTLTGIGTRSEVKRILKTGTVTVNSQTVKQGEMKIDPDSDRIEYRGETVVYHDFVCLMFHKPAGCVTATEDKRQKTVMDYITHENKKDLFPVGRLDLDTEGLLFLMTDGDLAHRMLSPKKHVDKTYFVRSEGHLTEKDKEAFSLGVEIGEKKPTLPAELKILSSGEISESELTIREGKFHQVKRMFQARDQKVIYLKRISMAGISLDPDLKPGEWRELTSEETERLKTTCR